MKDAFGRDLNDEEQFQEFLDKTMGAETAKVIRERADANMESPFMACKVVDIGQWKPEYQEAHRTLLKQGKQEAREADIPYPGSVYGVCAGCGVDVWIGPRFQQVREELPNVQFHCLMCVGHALADEDDRSSVAVVHLGNDWRPKLD